MHISPGIEGSRAVREKERGGKLEGLDWTKKEGTSLIIKTWKKASKLVVKYVVQRKTS